MAELKYSPEALSDLDEIWAYIRVELCNPDAADHTVDVILQKSEILREFPFSGAPMDIISRIHSDYRFLIADHFLIFYRIQENTVYIDRILYERRDCLRILLGKR